MKICSFILASVSAVTWQEQEERITDFQNRLRADGLNGIESTYSRKLTTAVDVILAANLDIEDCVEEWGLGEEEQDDSFEPEDATNCAYGKKIARNYLRLAKHGICLDGVQRGGKNLKKKIEVKIGKVISYVNEKICNQ